MKKTYLDFSNIHEVRAVIGIDLDIEFPGKFVDAEKYFASLEQENTNEQEIQVDKKQKPKRTPIRTQNR